MTKSRVCALLVAVDRVVRSLLHIYPATYSEHQHEPLAASPWLSPAKALHPMPCVFGPSKPRLVTARSTIVTTQE